MFAPSGNWYSDTMGGRYSIRTERDYDLETWQITIQYICLSKAKLQLTVVFVIWKPASKSGGVKEKRKIKILWLRFQPIQVSGITMYGGVGGTTLNRALKTSELSVPQYFSITFLLTEADKAGKLCERAHSASVRSQQFQ